MKKKILAIFCAVMMMFSVSAPVALAATLSSAEEQVLAKFETTLNKWHDKAGLDTAHVQQYYGEAKNALLAVDLSDTGCQEFSDAIDQVDAVFEAHNCKTQKDMWACYDEAAAIVNKVGDKYYQLHVTVDSVDHWATVTWVIDGKPSTVATTGDSASVVKQTGFGVGQTAAVVVLAAAVLAGAFVIVRKKQLFVA